MSKIRNNILILLLIIIGVFSTPYTLIAFDIDKADTKPNYTRLFYFRDSEMARESLYLNFETIDILAPQSYVVNESGSLEGDIDGSILNFAKSKDIKVVPLITNKNFGQKSLNTILNSKSKQTKLAKSMIKEARKKGFYGWQVDFEQMDETYKDKFSEFIKLLSENLHRENLSLSVAVIAKISDNPGDYKNKLWQNLIGVYDYDRLSENSDFISIMSYDAPDSKGPISPYDWLKQVIDYSVLHIPKEKISLGLGLYYWKWDDVRGKLTGIGGYEGLKIALGQYNPKLGYSEKFKAPYLKYTRNKVHSTIWYENEVSVKEKIDLIKKYNLLGFSAWALGLELPSVHLSMRS